MEETAKRLQANVGKEVKAGKKKEKKRNEQQYKRELKKRLALPSNISRTSTRAKIVSPQSR